MSKHLIPLSIIFFLSLNSSADSIILYQEKLKNQAIEKKLYEKNAWLALLYYRQRIFGGGFLSQADSKTFFLSPDGATDPQAELTATIDAMFLPEDLGDSHPQCIFPARFAWLKKKLVLEQHPKPDCHSLKIWKKQFNATQVSIIFPTSYLNNPSSMFGHAFLRFEPVDNSENLPFMAKTINFAADTTAQKGIIDYIYRGLFGGFPSTNSILPFHERFKRYSDIESRDIWEYTLDLSSEELEQLILHVWELKDSTFDYYFLDENCVYRLIALLEVARPDLRLTEEFGLYTIPADAIRKLKERGVIQSSVYRASAVKSFYHHTKYLNEDEKRIVIDIVRNKLPVDSPRLQSLSVKRKALTLAIASEYLLLFINKDITDRRGSTNLTHQILAERSKYSMPITFDSVPRPSVSPENGHRTHRIFIGGGQYNNRSFFSMGYRGVYHGLMDPLNGFEKGAEVEFLNVAIKTYKNNDFQLEKLGIISIKSLSPINQFLKPASWRFSIERKRKGINISQPLVNSLEGGMGITVEKDGSMLSGMAHVALDFGNAFDKGYGVGAGLDVNLVYQSEKYSYDTGVSTMKYIAGDNYLLTRIWGKFSLPLSKNNAMFLQIEYSPSNNGEWHETSLGIYHYY